MAEDKKKNNLWNFVDTLEGDKVVWMIVLMLILISIVAIFSSTSMLALQKGTSRLAIISDQLKISLAGLFVIIVCYNIKSIRFFRVVSQTGFFISIVLLAILAGHRPIGPLVPKSINSAWRVIMIGGFQLHVFEVVKVAMIMYLAWAVNSYRNDSFKLANFLAKKKPFWGKPIVKKMMYLYIPMFSVCLGIMVGSLSSTLFIGGIMFVTILIGGISVRELLLPLAAAGVGLFLCIGINSMSDKPSSEKPFPHLESALKRLNSDTMGNAFEAMKDNGPGTQAFQDALDKIKQPVSAKIAIKEGGMKGKGPGRSTQRYIVPIMFEDYMYSFIVEEYGLLGGIVVIILYISLLARGSIIVRNCENHFAKTAVAGLVVLITGQAMMHIMINCDLGPLTGQTLPMISHGKSSFIMFSLAFGIILSISRMAKRKIDREAAKAKPLMNRTGMDEVEGSMNDLDMLESGIRMEDLDGKGLPMYENDIPDYGLDDHNNE